MAEINFNHLNTEKIYVWPQYTEGHVESIRNVTRRNDPSLAYYKPSPEERDRILSLYRNESNAAYSPTGSLVWSAPGIRPGSLFNAIA